jgi:hypothetical protein
MSNTIYQDLTKKIESKRAGSAWTRGVKDFALSMVESLEENGIEITDYKTLKKDLLNGARNWVEVSEGGCFLIYDADIAEALCTPSELTRNDNGRLAPNSRESWLECQARALHQAGNLVIKAARK